MKSNARLITAMVTPMTASGEVDLGACAELARILISNGSDGLVVTGTTGESPTLTHDEHERVIELCVKESKGKIPVIAGTLSSEEKASIWGAVKAAVGDDVFVIAGATNYSTQESISGADAALNSGADALLLTVPYYNKPNQEGLFEQVVVTNSIPMPKEQCFEQLKVLSVANMLGEAIWRIHEESSISSMFR